MSSHQNGSLSARRAHEPVMHNNGSLSSRQAGISFPDRSDMISNKWTPVERNTLWREHVRKEASHSSIRTSYTRDPRTMVLITEKPHQRAWQPSSKPRGTSGRTRRTTTGGSAVPTGSHGNGNGTMLTPLSPRVPLPHTGTSISTGVPAIHSPRSYSHDEKELPPPRQSTAANAASSATSSHGQHLALPLLALPSHDTQQQHTREDDALLASLRHAELSPRDKFAYPTTSSHEYGWEHNPLAVNDRTDIERNHRGKRLCAITQYAKEYYVQQKMNPFSINAR